ncbi:MAG: class I SAM-dependent methyltransferase [Nitrospira sp.]|nr:class I SAM-dependent methyltransferase [Nitrospira sp.]
MHNLDMTVHPQWENRFSEMQMAIIAKSLLELATHSAVLSEMSDLDLYVRDFMSAIDGGDPSSIEDALLTLYIRLHNAGSQYSPSEKEILKKRNAYLCHPGGLSPLIMAEKFIRPESTVADLGAGNGLQGLLLQRICPHLKTLQIELSSELIRIGKIFQEALGISSGYIEWIHDDIVNVSIESADFVYIYRPAKPLDSGKELYKAIARKLSVGNKSLVIFSVADCLATFLDKRFSVFYTDGHLTCFVKNCNGF